MNRANLESPLPPSECLTSWISGVMPLSTVAGAYSEASIHRKVLSASLVLPERGFGSVRPRVLLK